MASTSLEYIFCEMLVLGTIMKIHMRAIYSGNESPIVPLILKYGKQI